MILKSIHAYQIQLQTQGAYAATAGAVRHQCSTRRHELTIPDWRVLLGGCTAVHSVSQPFGRHCAAMAAAHCHMLQAVVCDTGRSDAVLQLGHAQHLASAIAVCGAMCPAVLALYPELVGLQHQALVAVGGKPSEEWNGMTLCIAQAAAASPHVTAHMLASGAMETMLQQLRRTRGSAAGCAGRGGGPPAG